MCVPAPRVRSGRSVSDDGPRTLRVAVAASPRSRSRRRRGLSRSRSRRRRGLGMDVGAARKFPRRLSAAANHALVSMIALEAVQRVQFSRSQLRLACFLLADELFSRRCGAFYTATPLSVGRGRSRGTGCRGSACHGSAATPFVWSDSSIIRFGIAVASGSHFSPHTRGRGRAAADFGGGEFLGPRGASHRALSDQIENSSSLCAFLAGPVGLRCDATVPVALRGLAARLGTLVSRRKFGLEKIWAGEIPGLERA